MCVCFSFSGELFFASCCEFFVFPSFSKFFEFWLVVVSVGSF